MIKLSSLEVALRRTVYLNSYHEFFKWSFQVLFPNEKYEDSFHIKYLCDYLQDEVERIIRKEEKDKDVIVNIPPRTSKSLICSVALNAWIWTKAPYLPFITVSFDEKLTLINAQYCRDIIKSDEYQKLFGDIYQIRRDEDSKSYFKTTKGGFRLSATTGANITGHKGAIIIVDDPQNPKTSESPIERQTTINYYTQSLYNRLTPINLGLRVIVMQRLHQEDLTGYLLENHPEMYHHICLPATKDDNVKPKHLKIYYSKLTGLLDPIRLSTKVLSQFKKTLGSRAFAGQYGQKPAPDEGGLIDVNWFEIVEPTALVRNLEQNPICFWLDTASTDKTKNDPTSILTGVKIGRYAYVIDVKEVYMKTPQLLKYLKNVHSKKFQLSPNSMWYIEPKNSGHAIADMLRDETDFNVVFTKPPDTDKYTRVAAETPKWEAGRVKMVKGPYLKKFLEQCKFFPNATHDDMVDTLQMFSYTVFDENEILYA